MVLGGGYQLHSPQGGGHVLQTLVRGRGSRTHSVSALLLVCCIQQVIIAHFRDELKRHYNLGQYWLQVDVEDLASYDESLADKLTKQPTETLPLVSVVTRIAFKPASHFFFFFPSVRKTIFTPRGNL